MYVYCLKESKLLQIYDDIYIYIYIVYIRYIATLIIKGIETDPA